MVFKYRLEFRAGILIGEEAEIAVGERRILTQKHTEFLDDRSETFRKQPWRNETGRHMVTAVIRDHTEIQLRYTVLFDVCKEFGEMGKENAEIVVVGTTLLYNRDAIGHMEVADGLERFVDVLEIIHVHCSLFIR